MSLSLDKSDSYDKELVVLMSFDDCQFGKVCQAALSGQSSWSDCDSASIRLNVSLDSMTMSKVTSCVNRSHNNHITSHNITQEV